MNPLQLDIWRVLKAGRENAQTKGRIAALVYSTPRQVEAAIRSLRNDYGYMIGSACDRQPFGYFVLEDAEEIRRFRNQLISRMRNLNESLSAVDKGLADKLRGQLRLL